MTKSQIINVIETKDILYFETIWTEIKSELNEIQKQDLLSEIVENNYSDKHFGHYIKIFDQIIESKVSLNFNIDHYAPTLLSLVVYVPSRLLFDYFLKKGANINFIGDNYAFENEVEEGKADRYSTCLDFAELKLSDTLTVDYNYSVPKTKEYVTSWQDIREEEEITVKKQEYYYLIEQAQYLNDLIKTDRLVDHP